ncbi:hypothetical protein N7468_003009 [Penicillium chermesinum]|uniref:Adenine deaminase n=1 Tax=Penicillium chermesinum TaxID=63820 RepID=A0A9W9TR66_9EURO|nr:uncharacterized protein N7468_003009 [Penicillium chermesinum]KAJ5238390.1 hypothetical protein N7468_003009 [Penicillium chermesinum]KAJ6164053.1 hypothetical protein N7470_002725 [Penicillium chermesinum]
MCQSKIHEFLQGLPKCEHHVHLEGCLTPELTFQLASRNGITLPDDPAYASVDALKNRFERFTSLDDFLHYYFESMAVLRSEQDFADLAWAYFLQADADGVHHAEVFFDPQVHQERGISYETVVNGFSAGCKRAEQELGISTRLILCFLRHLPVASANELYDQFLASGHYEAGVIHGLGWSSSEVGPPKDMFRDIYASAAAKKIPLTAHAGEEGDASYISTALEVGAQRIDHGINLIQDPQLMQRVAKESILLSVCPVSNLKLQCVKSIAEVPIRKFLEAGVKFSINSDDPAYFGAYILGNYCAVQEAFNLSVLEWRIIAENSVQESWIPNERKAELLAKIEAHVKRFL